jgi:hypothetical protein
MHVTEPFHWECSGVVHPARGKGRGAAHPGRLSRRSDAETFAEKVIVCKSEAKTVAEKVFKVIVCKAENKVTDCKAAKKVSDCKVEALRQQILALERVRVCP